jgi:hypothetical protein
METAITFDVLKSAAATIKKDLAAAQRDFAKRPTSDNWRVCLRLMFTHQQIARAIRAPHVDRQKLAFDLTANPVFEWQEIISRATTNSSVYENLKEFAVF